AVVVVAQSQIQSEVRTNLPIVFEECAPFVLMVIAHSRDRNERVRRLADLITSTDAGYRSRQVQQQILGSGNVAADQAGNRIDAGYGIASLADRDSRQNPFRILSAVESVR